MSNEYTNKIILFSEEEFKGDALVLMWDGNKESSIFDLGKFKYKSYDGHYIGEFHPKSLIGIKGEWAISAFYNPIRARRMLPRFESLIKPGALFRSLTAIKTDEVDRAELCSYPDIKPNCFKMKFFPLHNSFIVSPVPDCLMDAEHNFRWVFREADELTIEYELNAGVSGPYLEFGRRFADGSDSRISPIEVKDDEKQWRAPIYRYDLKGDNNKIRFKTNGTKDPDYWFFNFCCNIGSKYYKVDPEMQSGAGTGK